MQSETQIVEGFWRAAYGELSWEAAIDAIAVPLNCRSGQIAVIDPRMGLIASILTRMTPAELRDVETHRVADPSVNPRILGLMRTAPGRCITDGTLLSSAERRDLPIYRDFFEPTGSAVATLIRSSMADGEACIAFSLLGVEGNRATTASARRLLERLLPAITDASRLAIRFGRMQANAMAVALDQHHRPCIALRRDMVPTAISPGAERLLSSGDHLGLRHSRLFARNREADRNLRNLVERIAALDPAAQRRNLVALPYASGDSPALVASLTPVPDSNDLRETCALLTLPDDTTPRDLSQALADVFRLTPTEAVIAIAIADGQSPAEIAIQRGQSRETVRTHLRNILQKTGTHRQSELAVMVRRLSG